MTDQLQALIAQFTGLRLIVVGDVILDEYLIGRAMRLSREAPVPVLEFEQRQLLPGGAANPAANLAALGAQVTQIGVIGADAEASQCTQVLAGRGIDVSALVVDSSRPTTVKTRVMAQMGLRFPQQVARIDKLSRQPVAADVERALIAMLEAHIAGAHAILFSDYRNGLITAGLIEAARAASGSNTLLTADAQGEFDKYAGFDLVKCNADEAREVLGRDLRGDDAFAAAAVELCQRLKLRRFMAITRGADGITLGVAGGEGARAHHLRASATSEVYDTVGAGDTTIALLTLATAAGADPLNAAVLANVAGGLVVRRVGNYCPTPDELRRALTEDEAN